MSPWKLLPVLLLAACASVPERVGKPLSDAVYRTPETDRVQPSSRTVLELGDVDWIRLGPRTIDHTEFGAVELPAGVYCVGMGKLFNVSFLVDPSMWAEHAAMGKMRLEAARRYRLAVDRTYGHGYTVLFQLMDAVADTVIHLEETTADFHPAGTVVPGVPVTGVLDGGDSTRLDCSPYEAFHLDVTAETEVEVTLESTSFVPFLLLVSPAGEFVGSEDAGAGRQRVHVEQRLQPGRWIVVANALRPDGAGEYRLIVTQR